MCGSDLCTQELRFMLVNVYHTLPCLLQSIYLEFF